MSRHKQKKWQRIAVIVLVVLISIGLLLPSFLGMLYY